jgi:hypothetical protein
LEFSVNGKSFEDHKFSVRTDGSANTVQNNYKGMQSNKRTERGCWKTFLHSYSGLKLHTRACAHTATDIALLIWKPSGTFCSFNYKGMHSIILMATVNVNHESLLPDVSKDGKVSTMAELSVIKSSISYSKERNVNFLNQKSFQTA